MIDVRPQIAAALLAACPNVKMSKPEGDVELPLVCYVESGNVPIDKMYTRLKWQVAAYASTFDELVQLTGRIDGVMHDRLGFTRTAKTSDDRARIGTDLYFCRMDYSGIINNDTYIVIKNSK